MNGDAERGFFVPDDYRRPALLVTRWVRAKGVETFRADELCKGESLLGKGLFIPLQDKAP